MFRETFRFPSFVCFGCLSSDYIFPCYNIHEQVTRSGTIVILFKVKLKTKYCICIFQISITSKDAPDLVEWLTTNTTTTTTIYPPLESQELFSDSLEDISVAEPFLALDQEEEVARAGTQQSDNSTQISPRRLVPAVAAYSLLLVIGDVDDDVSTDVTWVPTREEEEGSSEGEMDQQIGRRSRPNLHCTGGTNH